MYTTAIYWWCGEYGEPDDIGVYLFRHAEYMNTVEVVERLESAIRAFLKTERGQQLVAHNGEFNWGDAVNEISDLFWLTFGIETVDFVPSDNAYIVNHDRNFAREEHT